MQDVMAIHRDYYEGYTLPTVYDVTKDPKFIVSGKLAPGLPLESRSPLAARHQGAA